MIPAAAPPGPPRGPKQTVDNPLRNAFPGIYDDPRGIADDASYNVAPESVAMKRLFGVTRGELHERSEGRKGSAKPMITVNEKAKTPPPVTSIMTPANAKRLQNVLHEAGKHPGIKHGMDAWYNLDPAYERLKELVGRDEAKARFTHLNTMIGMMSPGSEVKTEIARGVAAHTLQQQGKIDKFYNAKDPARIPGHPYHKTSHVEPLKKYLEHGKIMSDAAKVPLYVQASEAHETGNQTELPVPDAHFTRGLGLPDTRTAKTDDTVKSSMKQPEYRDVGPWFRKNVSDPLGIEAVPAQARLWGTMAQHTGVTTPIGSPKLELLADHIMRVAKHHGIQPEKARDMVLMGHIYFRGGTVTRATGGRIEPTDAQKQAGNYRKDHVTFHGLRISIENRRGDTRRGTAKDGRKWAVVMPYDYGYIKRTEGADGDHVDVCVGPDPKSTSVFIVDQMEGSMFDEHKCMLGFNSLAEAKNCYLKGFSDGKDRSGHISRLTMEEFRVWLKHLDTKKPTTNIDRALKKTSVYASPK